MIEVPSDVIPLKEYATVSAIFNVLLLHTGPILEFEYVGEIRMDYGFDQILLYLSKNKIVKKCIFNISIWSYKIPCSFFSLHGLESIELINSLRRFLSSCPLLMDVILEISQEDTEGEKQFTCMDLIKCVPLLRTLDILDCYMEDLCVGGMPQKLPAPLVHLKFIILEMYLTDHDQVSSTLCLLRNAPNLEKIRFTMFEKEDAPHISVKCFDLDHSSYNFDSLQELEMIYYFNATLEFEIVKLVMAKSPRLEKVRILLYDGISVDEELKIRDDLMRLPVLRGSASAILRIER
ncbi:uncharacterized protein [Rutidosis leptorrhynchoides]|uniref:uncharacterized protein isoform X2 n=1 Tax=Rutidosis leptorrhynchoides TaxID=125765 RepID=UPI003A9955FA